MSSPHPAPARVTAVAWSAQSYTVSATAKNSHTTAASQRSRAAGTGSTLPADRARGETCELSLSGLRGFAENGSIP